MIQMIDGMKLDGMNLLPDNPEAFLPPETDKAPSGGEEVEPEVPETNGKSILKLREIYLASIAHQLVEHLHSEQEIHEKEQIVLCTMSVSVCRMRCVYVRMTLGRK